MGQMVNSRHFRNICLAASFCGQYFFSHAPPHDEANLSHVCLEFLFRTIRFPEVEIGNECTFQFPVLFADVQVRSRLYTWFRLDKPFITIHFVLQLQDSSYGLHSVHFMTDTMKLQLIVPAKVYPTLM